MKLNKVSYKRVEEQLGRGFDILTNDGIKENMGATTFMKKQTTAWDRLSPRAGEGTETNQGFDNTANNSNFEFSATNF